MKTPDQTPQHNPDYYAEEDELVEEEMRDFADRAGDVGREAWDEAKQRGARVKDSIEEGLDDMRRSFQDALDDEGR